MFERFFVCALLLGASVGAVHAHDDKTPMPIPWAPERVDMQLTAFGDVYMRALVAGEWHCYAFLSWQEDTWQDVYTTLTHDTKAKPGEPCWMPPHGRYVVAKNGGSATRPIYDIHQNKELGRATVGLPCEFPPVHVTTNGRTIYTWHWISVDAKLRGLVVCERVGD